MSQTIPVIIREQFSEIDLLTNQGITLTEAECRARFPELIIYIRSHISLVSLMRSQGIRLRPLSPDAPDVYISPEGCPFCNGAIIVKE